MAAARKYIIIVDAGSTGSRGFVYELETTADGVQSRHIKAKGMKMTPGISSFASHVEDIGSYFAPLFVNAAKLVPPPFQADTEVHILGTAGMRLVTAEDQELIWNQVVLSMTEEKDFPFHISRENVRTINGQEEAYYAALSTNYIAKKIDSNLIPVPGAQLVGALDMGGSSTQLVLHTGTPAGERVAESHFWSHSWLSYGVDKVRERVWKHFIHQAKSPHLVHSGTVDIHSHDYSHTDIDIRIPVSGSTAHTPYVLNDCLFRSYSEVYFDPMENKKEIYMMHGTGDVSKCKDALREVLWPEGCTRSEKSPSCSLDGIEHPPIAGNSFFGMSVYYFALDCVRFLGVSDLTHWPISNVRELIEASESFCEMDWHDVNGTFDHSINGDKGKHKKTSIDHLPYRCVEALYLSLLLEEGFGFDLDQRSLTLALKVEGVEVEWTLGVLLTKVSAHSSSDAIAHSSSTASAVEELTEGVRVNLLTTADSSAQELEWNTSGVENVETTGPGEPTAAPDASSSPPDSSPAAEAEIKTKLAEHEEKRVRVAALKAAGLPAVTLKKLFPDMDIDELFKDEDNDDVDVDASEQTSGSGLHPPLSRYSMHNYTSHLSFLRSKLSGWREVIRLRVLPRIPAASSALLRQANRLYDPAKRALEMFTEVLARPVIFVQGRSRAVGRVLYRKLCEYVHKKP